MSEKELRWIIGHASDAMAQWFAKNGEIGPMWHAIKADGDHFVVPIPAYMTDKDVMAATISVLFKIQDVRTYCFVDEAWTAEAVDGEARDKLIAYLKTNESLEDYPDRVEIVVFQGEDHEAGMLCAQRKIIRPAIGPPRLGPLEYFDIKSSEGRFVGMLPRTTRAN